ncbi:MAG: hypothetical protein ABIA37_02155 [Candidatus Woesearchaeota archaeon]
MKLTPVEERMFREKVIREYQIKHEKLQKENRSREEIIHRLKKIMPINILVGMAASTLLIYTNGWKMFAYLMLSGVIWLTLISTLVSTFLQSKK